MQSAVTLTAAFNSGRTRALDYATRGFRWWVSEIVGLLPHRVRAFLERSERHAVLSFEPDVTVFELPRSGRGAEFIRAPRNASPRQIDALDRKLSQYFGRQQRTALLRLGDQEVLAIAINLPLSAEPSLRKIIGNDIDRQTPFAADQVYFDYRVKRRDRTAKRLDIELAVAERAMVDPLVAMTQTLGFVPEAILYTPPSGEATIWHLLPGANEPEWTARNKWLRRLLNLAIFGLVVALAIMLGIRVSQQEASLEAEVAAAKAQASSVERLEKDIAALVSRAGFLGRKRSAPMRLQILDAVTQILPDNSWAFEFKLSDREIALTGYSRDPFPLITAIDGSKLFSDARFRSPVTDAPNGQGQRFDLAFQLKDRAPP
jgi:general secretion pathway protein L